MAESDVQQPLQQQQRTETNQEGLKYLDFVHVAAIQALVCFSRLYDLAKENSGPLKPGVQSVEGTVKTVIGPVVDKFHGVPYELLKFVDRKVGDSMTEIERHVPSLVRTASSKAINAAQRAPEVARSVATEVQRAGVVETAAGVAKAVVARCEPAAKELYTRYEPVVERCAVSSWRSLNRLPLFPQAAQIVVPTAAYWSGKYNGALSYGREKGYAVAAYLPPVPTERIAKVFADPPAAESGQTGEAVLVSQ